MYKDINANNKTKKFTPKIRLSKNDGISASKHKKKASKPLENLETGTESKKTKITDKNYGETCGTS